MGKKMVSVTKAGKGMLGRRGGERKKRKNFRVIKKPWEPEDKVRSLWEQKEEKAATRKIRFEGKAEGSERLSQQGRGLKKERNRP